MRFFDVEHKWDSSVGPYWNFGRSYIVSYPRQEQSKIDSLPVGNASMSSISRDI